MPTRAQNLASLDRRIRDVRSSIEQAPKQTGLLSADRERIITLLKTTLAKLEARKAEIGAARDPKGNPKCAMGARIYLPAYVFAFGQAPKPARSHLRGTASGVMKGDARRTRRPCSTSPPCSPSAPAEGYSGDMTEPQLGPLIAVLPETPALLAAVICGVALVPLLCRGAPISYGIRA